MINEEIKFLQDWLAQHIWGKNCIEFCKLQSHSFIIWSGTWKNKHK